MIEKIMGVISLNPLNRDVKLGFDESEEMNKVGENLGFKLHEEDPSVMGKITDKDKEKVRPITMGVVVRPPNVNMKKGENGKGVRKTRRK